MHQNLFLYLSHDGTAELIDTDDNAISVKLTPPEAKELLSLFPRNSVIASFTNHRILLVKSNVEMTHGTAREP